MNHEKTYYKSPIGAVEITGTKTEILTVDFVKRSTEKNLDIDSRARNPAPSHYCGSGAWAKKEEKNCSLPIIKNCAKQLNEYFTGERKRFSLKLKFYGTDFQKKVWQELVKIPFGKTVSYKFIAERIGNPRACRAVGGAIHKNKVAIIIPCHRAIGSNGKLVGYAGGLWRKKWLLKHEKGLLGACLKTIIR